MPGLPVHHQLPEFTQTHVHWDSDAIQPSWTHRAIYKSWIFIGRTDAEAETLILWQPDTDRWLIWKDPDAGKDWRREEKGATEDEMTGWHHWMAAHEFEWTPGVGDRQGGLTWYSPWGHRESDMTEQLNWIEDFISEWISVCPLDYQKTGSSSHKTLFSTEGSSARLSTWHKNRL